MSLELFFVEGYVVIIAPYMEAKSNKHFLYKL